MEHTLIAILLSVKFWVACAFIFSAVYIHYRGTVRFAFLRQLTDHSTFFAPINVFMYLFGRTAKGPFLDLKDFPELAPLRDNWRTIREEAQRLSEARDIKAADGYTDAGFNSFFRNGWKRFTSSGIENRIPPLNVYVQKH